MASDDRISFALVLVKNEILLGYVTCRETDASTLYWQHGGAFPGTINTSVSWLGYQELIEWCKPRYKRIFTLIENTNKPMLKMAMKVGFLIQGIKFFNGKILLEHSLELQ